MITIDGGTGKIMHNGLNVAAAPMVDQWRVAATLDINSGANFITSNWERVDSDGFGKIGDGMSESSGVFTFPSTGIYHIQTTVNFRNPSATSGNFAYISTTTDGSTFDDAALSLGRVSAANSYSTSTCDFVFDVTDTSTHKVKLKVYVSSSSTDVEGDSNRNMTSMTFTRLGDT